jgi:hypothetical protein
MQDWQQVLSFLQEEVARSESRGDPATLQRMLSILSQSAQLCYSLIKHLQDPENKTNKICLRCGVAFYSPSRWVKTCSVECHEKWINDPLYIFNDDNKSTLLLMQELEQEKVLP